MALGRKPSYNEEDGDENGLCMKPDDDRSIETVDRTSAPPQNGSNSPPCSDEDTTSSETRPRTPATVDTAFSRMGSFGSPKLRKRPPRKEKNAETRNKHPPPHWRSTRTPLLSGILADIFGFPVASYRHWKWPVLIYIVWLLLSHLVVSGYVTIVENFEPICSVPLIGSKLPLCNPQDGASSRPINIAKVSSCQKQLESVLEAAGKGLGLAMDMLRNGYAIRDLTIRVKHSELKRKDELGQELDQLIGLTTRTSDGLADFTSRVASVTDSMIALDRNVVRNLQAITNHEHKPTALSQKMISSLLPLSAFEPRFKIELELKDVFARTTTEMSARLFNLIEEAGHLRYLLRDISDVLDQLKGLALDEIKDSPEMAVLAGLWVAVARRDDYEEYKSHQTLLTEITVYYATAMEVMKSTSHALDQMRSDLDEFRDIHESPALVWRNFPLEVTIEMMSESLRRLESGRRRIDDYSR